MTFTRKQTQKKFQPKGGVTVIHEDNDIIVIDKPSGIPTIGSDRDKSRTVHTILNEYVRKGNPRSNNRIYVVHRLDRETSGILIFAKNEQTKNTLQTHWPETDKHYLAVVHGTPTPRCGTISSYLAENKAFTVYSTQNPSLGKLSQTEYNVLKEHKGFSLLQIHLLTGRKHQIRVHMSEKGHAIVGDKKYGRRNDSYKFLALHACSISFKHPVNGEQLSFKSPMPDYFSQLIGRIDA